MFYEFSNDVGTRYTYHSWCLVLHLELEGPIPSIRTRNLGIAEDILVMIAYEKIR